MKRIVVLIVVFQTGFLFAQSPDYTKLSKVCELWGLIKYFHPSKPGDKFDSAFAAQVPAMLRAKTDEEWKASVGAWLSSINDNHTRIIGKDAQLPEGVMKTEFIKDSILLVTISGPKIFNDWSGAGGLGAKVIEQSKKARGIIFDLRQAGFMTQYEGYLNYVFDFTGMTQHFGTSFIPKTRSLYYSGFKQERGGSSGGYSINYIQQDYVTAGNYTSKSPKVVWLVNEFSELPGVALSQKEAGIGMVVSSRDNIDALLPLTRSFNITDNIIVKYKTVDFVLSSQDLLRSDHVYSASDDPIEKARGLLLNKPVSKKSSAAVHSQDPPASVAKYPSGKYPSVGFRTLAAAKMYTVIHNFFPYHQFMDKNWRTVLDESLPAFVEAKDDIEYGLAVAKMYANIRDSHGFIQGNKGLEKIRGAAPSPVYADYIENKVIVSGLRNDSICKLKGVHVGDIIVKVNGVPVEKLMEKPLSYYANSTPQAANKNAAQLAIRGNEGEEGIFTLQDEKGKTRDVKLLWAEKNNKYAKDEYKRKEIELINPHVGYADLTRLKQEQTDEMFEKFKDTKVIIFDMRGYPNGTAWTIAPRLTEKKDVALALFRRPEVLGPNTKRGEMLSSKAYMEFIQTIASSDKWKYKGKTVMLINVDAMSQAEHTGLFFESVNNTTFIGSPTVGANGDVTNFQIPGEIWLSFSGQGVWHADGRQLQRLGLQPHVPVSPTIKGVREGKDEVFDKAMEWISKNVK
jgi:C-terminal processing protease CtpA/Prc